MKVFPEQLGQQLQARLLPVYLLSGDEPLQLMESADAVRRAAKSAGHTGRETFYADSSFDWTAFYAACDSYPLFGEPRLLDLRLSAKPDKVGAEALLHFAGQPPRDAILLVSLPKLTAQEQKTRWFQSLDRIGGVIQVWPLEGERLLRWLDRRLNQKGLLADQSGLRLLAARVEGNLLAAAQEVEKLHILYGSGQLTDEQIIDSVADSARYDVFALADQVLRGHAGKAYRVLTGLKAEGIAAPVALWALTRELRLVSQLQSELASGGVSLEVLFSKYKLWDSRKAALNQALQRLSQAAVHRAVLLAGNADRVMKGRAPGDEWDALLVLCMSLTNPPSTPDLPIHPSYH